MGCVEKVQWGRFPTVSLNTLKNTKACAEANVNKFIFGIYCISLLCFVRCGINNVYRCNIIYSYGPLVSLEPGPLFSIVELYILLHVLLYISLRHCITLFSILIWTVNYCWTFEGLSYSLLLLIAIFLFLCLSWYKFCNKVSVLKHLWVLSMWALFLH
jgi:hypothetical protein